MFAKIEIRVLLINELIAVVKVNATSATDDPVRPFFEIREEFRGRAFG